MSEAAVSPRNSLAAEHLRLLHGLTQELECAMDAIARNSLDELESSIARQEILSARLEDVVRERNVPELGGDGQGLACVGADLGCKIRMAAEAVQTLNLRYSLLLRHATRSVAYMISLFHSISGEIHAGAAGPKHGTLSCQG